MQENIQGFGKLKASYGISPLLLQRAAIVAVLSFAFFVAMLAAFYIRGHIGYLTLAAGFFVIYLFTLISWFMQRKSVVNVFENGIKYNKFQAYWNEIEAAQLVGDGKNRKYIEIKKDRIKSVKISSSLVGFEQLVDTITANIHKS